MAIGGYLLMAIDEYYMDGNWCLLMVSILVVIGDYSIGGYWWLLVVINWYYISGHW
jgi:hypothetical protein